MRILGIETSCDETAVSVVEGKRDNTRVLSSVIFSQINIHKKYGGVVPEVAARNHITKIIPIIEQALTSPSSHLLSILPPPNPLLLILPPPNPLLVRRGEAVPPLLFRRGAGGEVRQRGAGGEVRQRGAGGEVRQRGAGGEVVRVGEGIDAIAVTAGPGLISSLIIGIETAKVLAYAWHKPLIAVNHLAGHVYSAWLDAEKKPRFPALVLIVSGGHTELVLMRAHLKFKIIGQTRDDAAGEAFDKVAKMLGLGYPGGPAVAANAANIKKQKTKNKNDNDIEFPRPMMHDDNFDFSFSGIKTSVLYKIQKDLPCEIPLSGNFAKGKIISQGKHYKKHLPEYCAAFQEAVIDVLVHKTLKAAQKYRVKSIILAGGVAANTELRRQLGDKIKTELPKVSYHIPDLKYTTDNAAMIAAAGYFMARQKKLTPWQRVKVDCNLQL